MNPTRILNFCRFTQSKIFKRFSSSALYITGDKAHTTFAVLTPHLDFEERLQKKDQLERNLKLRECNINMDELSRIWNFYKHVESKKNDLEDSRESISQTIKNLGKKGNRYAEKINNLKAHGKIVKEDLRVLKESFWSIEEKAVIQVLALPNDLHEKTPENEEVIIQSYLNHVARSSNKFHLDSEIIKYTNPYNYYLKDDAAIFDLYSTFYFADKLLDKKYLQFSNSDFARSVIVEGCGEDYSDNSKVFTVNEIDLEHKHEQSRLHLTGGASLTSFMAFYSRHTIFPTLLPLKYFTVGKKYQPVTSEAKSLLDVGQESAVNIFIATEDSIEDMNHQFDIVLKDAIEIYESLGYHFRVTFVPVKQLQKWESLRASFQMFSVHLNSYVEVGNISLCGNYVSKRVLFNYGKAADLNYPCIITGTLLNVPKLLACVLENSDDLNKLLLPDVFKTYTEN